MLWLISNILNFILNVVVNYLTRRNLWVYHALWPPDEFCLTSIWSGRLQSTVKTGKSLKWGRVVQHHTLTITEPHLLFAIITYAHVFDELTFATCGSSPPSWNFEQVHPVGQLEQWSCEHRGGYNPDWKNQYPWLLSVFEICGLLCELCQCYGVKQRSSVGTWVLKPCTLLHKDVIERHNQSNLYKEALDHEATRLSIVRHGDIQQAFQHTRHGKRYC